MPWIRVVPPEEAEGRLKDNYDASLRRAGKVFHIVRSMSLAPRILESSFDLYQKVMYARPGLARYQREMLAVVVSKANDCHYWTLAHAADLRAEVEHVPEAEREAYVLAIQGGWRTAPLGEADAALCAYGEKLTLEPARMSAADVEALRQQGFDDVAIHDAIQVVAYFNYINRIADAIHVDLEPDMAPYPGS